MKSNTKKLTGTFYSIISNSYSPNFKVDYSFQYRYRSKAVSVFFKKELFFALVLLIVFQYVNIQYISLFNIDLLGDTEKERLGE